MPKMYGANYQGSLPGGKIPTTKLQVSDEFERDCKLLPFIGQYKYFTVI